MNDKKKNRGRGRPKKLDIPNVATFHAKKMFGMTPEEQSVYTWASAWLEHTGDLPTITILSQACDLTRQIAAMTIADLRKLKMWPGLVSNQVSMYDMNPDLDVRNSAKMLNRKQDSKEDI